MKRFKVKIMIRKTGNFCQSCIQSFETELSATRQDEAFTKGKKLSGANLDSHKIIIELNKEF
ncbi:hypothetical protein HOS16_gp44 [Shigella phage vB_SflS-ISF001]|uniref:Uncharacterized protein n=1 Tax=Shigella phage vB_SflS-ISF001 TaxID=2048005 RepID=A0A2D1GPZ5_9CAUD|nr:hypothetical protein HOS16_gp44 [Shigella phage vB_SflS-ISF001]ATN94122.1 hypothetical protein FLXISF001_044 [Shigella phage vB_SflS-ISF001]